jgi:hypothetical protein
VTRRVATRLEVKAQPWSKLQEGQRTQTVQVITARRVAAASPAQDINCPRRCTQVPWPYFYGLASHLVGAAGQLWEAEISIAQLATVPKKL